ncbi:eukaryotic translation initiation factor 2A-like [Apostichopus japonicus]|uniref:eukaryotic translation initiation factor 2A-like n=1 Tax=Stichopus japonicus TaxID=307972 RepID=UPI003AB6523E
MDKIPSLAVRGTEGLSLFKGPPVNKFEEGFGSDTSPKCRVMKYSKDGSLFAWCNGDCVFVVKTDTFETVFELDLSRTSGLVISPKNTCLATWEIYQEVHGRPTTPNFHIYDLESGECLRTITQKRQLENWEPQWTEDESICAQISTGEVLFYQNNDFSKPVQRLQLKGISSCKISPGPVPPKVAVHAPGAKGAPSFVRLFRYPNFSGPGAALANKSFYKADSAHILWNKQATAVLVICVADVDQSGASYYGEQTLHYLSIKGEGSNVTLSKKGPIYSIDWSPVANEFIVVYGFMPAKSTLFNHKCEPVFDFGTSPKNSGYYNPLGDIICFAGFGNLRGQMEFWDRKQLTKIGAASAPDTTQFLWSPDGQHFATATCSPRLREGNGFKIWHYNGTLLYDHPLKDKQELWDIQWQTFPEGTFTPKAIKAPSSGTFVEPSKPAAYRPPHARDRETKDPHADSYEAPGHVKQADAPEQPLSKSAQKNKRKREAKAKAKSIEPSTSSRSQEQRDAIAMATHILTPEEAPTQVGVSQEMDKRIKTLKKKLKAIEKLKEQQQSGKPLEANQLEKLQTEESILQELKHLDISYS